MTSEALTRDSLPTDRSRPDQPTGHPIPGRKPQVADATVTRLPVRIERLALAGLLVGTALLYLWGLGASGWANTFYSAAAQGGSESWKAFLFGSSDAANSITVDKTPLALWPMGLSVRLFGLSSLSILAPQALEGVGAVAMLYATVRRTTRSPGAGLLAGAVMALTPVAVLMFRFNNPDALLVLLLVASAHATLRAVEASTSSTSGSRAGHWLALAGVLVGLAFLAKMLQSFLVVPALVAVYAIFAGVPIRRRILHLLGAFAGMVLSAGWWIAIVSLWPAASRPYIGGSQHNSILELTLGYNGFGRLDGSETGSVGGSGNAGGNWGATGLLRMFGSEVGTQVAWLFPAALILGIAAYFFTSGGAVGRPVRAGLTLWLGWLVVTALTFSLMAGIFHPYYTVALAPAIGALIGIGAWALWQRRDSLAASGLLSLTTALTTALSFDLLVRDASWHAWLRHAIAIVGCAATLMIVGVRHLPRRLGPIVASAALVAGLAGPAAYSLATAATPHTGSIPSAGPSSAGGGFGGGFGAAGGASTGGLLDGSTSSASITALLKADASSYTWVAAAVGSNTAAGYQLASQEPVMAIGGFNGSDPSPTLAQFRAWVTSGRIHYFIAGGGQGGIGGALGIGPGGSSTGSNVSSQISSWVEQTFTPTTVDGVTLYDLTTG